jgi:hypothetical protein
MNIMQLFRRDRARGNRPVVVVFAGGMGTQIISAAVYFSMKRAGRAVFADVSYFNNPQRLAQAGNAGQLTHWGWQLDAFGMPRESFETRSDLTRKNADLLFDGPEKLELSFQALAHAEIRDLFRIPTDSSDILPAEFPGKFLCMHVRRGDYVNVASHLIADAEFLELAKRFAALSEGIVVISDSPIEVEFRAAISSHYRHSMFLDGIDAFAAHRIMRSAGILICSNSTFSLTAAALSPDILTVVPRQWYGGKDRQVEAAIHARCSFQIMNNGNVSAVSAGKP